MLGRRRSQVVRQRSAKPSSAGSIPAVASISTPADFNFASTVVSHGWYLLAPFRWSRKGALLYRPEILGGKVRHLRITAPTGAAALHVEGAKPSTELTAKVTRMFQLH